MALRLGSSLMNRSVSSHLKRAQICRNISVGALLRREEGEPSRVPYTTDIQASRCLAQPERSIPAFRVVDMKGRVLNESMDPKLDDATVTKMYEQMALLMEMDRQLENAQKMGLISFYMKCKGEEATHFGSAAALDPGDMVYAQYREAGILLWRGFTIDNMMNQCFATHHDTGKGRQMPVHYGSKEHNHQFISSCLSTQIPQAPGYAYGLKQAGSKNCVMVYFGDGAAQEGDCHAGMNFAATLGCPVIFFCRNNGYAISMPVKDNYVGDGIAARAQGYGMESVRVDGNDTLAVYQATKHAREVAVSQHRPVLVEAMTLRLDSHSSSDEQSTYRDMAEVEYWERENLPLNRLRGYLENRGIWDESKDGALKSRVKKEVAASLQKARKELKPNLDELFNDVFDELPPSLQKQRQEMLDMVKLYKDHYPVKLHKQ